MLQAAEGAFSQDQFRRFVYPNIRAKALIRFIDEQFAGVDRLRLSSLAIELCEAKSCVSRLHARVADFKDRNGDKVKFNYVTNGIHIKTWVLPEIRDLYCKLNILDHFDLPTINYRKNLELLTVEDIKRVRSIGRDELNKVLSKRKDQYGNAISIPNEALVFNFKRRFANYKRPYMVFENIETFKNILLKHNAHFILAGKVHLGDTAMYEKLKEILKMIDQDIVLKERVHYIQDYDEELARALAVGSDIAINVPVVGLEACGTSWEKDIANFKLLISTNDGGVADLDNPPIFEVKGKNYEEELASLYKNMEDAATAVQNDLLKRAWVIKELTGYLPVISGARMLKDYLTYFLILGISLSVIFVFALSSFGQKGVNNKNQADAKSNTLVSRDSDLNTATNLKDKIHSGLLIDVRTKEEFKEKHIKGAVNLDVNDLNKGDLPKADKDKEIYLYCKSGNRARQAKIILEKAGYKNVKNLGGLDDVLKIGLELVK